MDLGDVCSYCQLECVEEAGPHYPSGIDPCLGRLPGVMHACCGHGFPQYGYIMFENNMIVRNMLTVELYDSPYFYEMDFPPPKVDITDPDTRYRWMGEPYMNHFFNNWIGLLGFEYDESLWNPEVAR